MAWFYTIGLRGHGTHDKTTLTFELDAPEAGAIGYASAITAAGQIKGALVDITDAFVTKETVSEVIFEDNQRPADDVDCYEEAALVCYLNAPTDAEKLHVLRVPAPIDAMFMADGETVDTSNALVLQFVQQVGDHAFVSDHEQIDYSAGNDGGLKKGYKRTRAKRFSN